MKKLLIGTLKCEEKWYFPVVDVVSVLTEQPDARHARTYWAVLKKRLTDEGANQLLTICKQLKMEATDGKSRLTAENRAKNKKNPIDKIEQWYYNAVKNRM